MSGGYFEHQQYRLEAMADQIEDVIYKNTGNDPDEYYHNYSEETLENLKRAVWLLKRTQTYVHRIDWLLSGDDGEETFHKRLKNDLNN
jgi:hypothetical protein